MYRNIIITLFIAVVSLTYSQEVIELNERLSDFEIDKKVAAQGGSVIAMAKKSLANQRANSRLNRKLKKTPKELRKYAIYEVQVTKIESAGIEYFRFTSTWADRLIGIMGGYVIEQNDIPIGSTKPELAGNEEATMKLALNKIEEAKRMLDLEIITQKEYDSIFNANKELIRKGSIKN